MNLTISNIDLLFDVAILAILSLIFSFCYTIELTLLDIKTKIEKLSPTTKEMTNSLKENKPTIYYESDKDSVSIVSDSDYEPDDEYSDEEEDEIDSDSEEEDESSDEEEIMKKKSMNSCIDYIKVRNKDGVIDYVKNFGSTVIVNNTTKADRHWVYSNLNGIIDAKWNVFRSKWYLNSSEVLLDNKETNNLVYSYDVDEEKSGMESMRLYSGRISKPPTYYDSSFILPPVKKTKTVSDAISKTVKVGEIINDKVEAIKISGDSVIAEWNKACENNGV